MDLICKVDILSIASDCFSAMLVAVLYTNCLVLFADITRFKLFKLIDAFSNSEVLL